MTQARGRSADLPLPRMFPGGGRIGAEEEAAVVDVIRRKRLFRYGGVEDGPSEVAAFEIAFAETMASGHAIAVTSGTLALMTALAAAGIGPGDEVIVPAYTWVSTAAAVLAVGAVPVVADIDETLSLDVASAEQRITARTRAVIPVHMRGAPADMDAVTRLALRFDLTVIEDTAQAIGGRYRGRRLGTIGQLGCFSLQFNKIITCGEGGVVVTADPTLRDRALMYHDVAASQRAPLGATPVFYGLVARMSELQGAVARVQLRRLDDIIADCRRHRAAILDTVSDALARSGIRLRPCPDPDGDTAIALVMLCPGVEVAVRLNDRLAAGHIPSRILYEPIREDFHVASFWQPLLERRSWSRETPWDHASGLIDGNPTEWRASTDVLARAVHVDVSPDLTEHHVDLVATALRSALTDL